MIPIADPKIGGNERDRIEGVLDSGMLADGPEVREFEAEFAEYCGTDHGVATSNGTTALHAALAALEIGAGDRVLTTPFSFVATANAIRHVGAKPVFADVDPATYNLDPDAARAVARAEDVDAILAVHLYGLPAEMDALGELAAELDVPLIEDAAQAHGAEFGGERVGSIGDAGCFSFYPTKNMTTGEGGILTTDRDDVARRARQFINHGRTETYEHATVGHNFRMTSIAAAIGRAQLERLPTFIERRRENAARLSAAIETDDVVLPVEPDGTKHVYHQYTVRSTDRDGLAESLESNGVGTGVYYPTCIHEQPAYEGVSASAPIAEAASREVVSLPVHPAVSADETDRIAEVIDDYGA
ncbi:DegT/DnrJ/EryC1/StrS family aminotransferase [Natrarchaeobius oligotrophus]|uniref:DegT/DnrJ/EryC1/StrS family aminotransferase n=1 Tax=Natrarchaeobius chitinivorans TaxID=1679083 RepID=A0A3N6NBV8_NATCH|nr:DegT/DnrJ/EryC1/StrS family aminotransferase [Natrarchaeobius chitinivorans]RQG96172.1 DegT/DnrJ/EryC1/StrS family aminotransferase [Natrarchaeobius chitinivorans]